MRRTRLLGWLFAAAVLAAGCSSSTSPSPPPEPIARGPLGFTQGGGTADVFIGSTPTPTATDTPSPDTANLWVAPSAGSGCSRSGTLVAYNSATDCSLAAAVTASQAGDLVLFKTGSYGTWTGTNKAITLRAQSGQSPTMEVNFASGDTGFTLDGMTGMGGIITNATSITIKNSSFASQIEIDGTSTHGIMLDHNTHNWMQGPTLDGTNSKIFSAMSGNSATVADPALTIKNSQFFNSDLDGIHTNGDGIVIDGNEFRDMCDFNDPGDSNHTDQIQFQGGTKTLIIRNWMHTGNVDPNDGKECNTQGLSSFDSDTDGVIIQDNVIDVSRPSGLEWYSDQDSVITHNTIVYRAICGGWTGQTCGHIDINRKPADPAGSGTLVRDNIATSVEFSNGSTGTQNHNMCHDSGCSGTGSLTANPVFVGGSVPTSYAGFCLASGSPGKGAASDGLDIGIRC